MTEQDVQAPPVPARRRRRGSWIALGAIVGAVAVLAYVFAGRFGQDPRLVDSPLVGRPMPALVLPYLEQPGSLDFAELDGQVLVVNFWASWCVPCRSEQATLTSAATAYADRGVHFVGILYQDQPGPALAFLDQYGRGTNYSYVVDSDSRATVEMGVFGIPETYFVDSSGTIRGRYQGEIPSVLLRQTLEDLLDGSTTAP